MIRNIATHRTEDEKLGLVYQVFITPLETHLVVDGSRRPITSGMTLTAEIKVGKRRAYPPQIHLSGLEVPVPEYYL